MKFYRLRFLFLICLGALAQPSHNAAPGATVSVRGTAVDSRTGKPLSGVHVMLTGDLGSGSSIVYGAMTDAQGRFAIPDIPAGDYRGSAEKRGFIFVPDRKKSSVTWYGALTLKFKADEHPADLVLPMVERAIIAGRVLDEHGDPMINAGVMALSVDEQTAGASSTNGRGEFRVSVPPGKYRVEGSKYSDSEATGSTRGYVHTYYPSTTQIGGAAVVEAFAGRVVNGVEIRLVRPAAFKVSGEITGLPQGDRSLSLYWTPADSDRIGIEGWESGRLDFHTREARADGAASSISFSSSPLTAGTYYFYAECCAGGSEELQSRIALVTLSDSDLQGITLVLVPGAEVTATVALAGGLVAPSDQPVSVALVSEGPPIFTSPLRGERDASGNFTFHNVLPNRYSVGISPLPEDAYMTVALNNAIVRGGLLDFSGGAAGMKLTITLRGGAARLTGQVRKAKADAPEPRAQVLLFPEHEGYSVDQVECQSAETNENGAYSFKGLVPGHYRILARNRYSRKQCDQAAEAIRRGLIVETVELRPRTKAVKDLRVADEASDEPR